MRSRLAAVGGLVLLGSLALAGCGSDGSDDIASDDAPTSGTACGYTADGAPAAKEVDPPAPTATMSGDVDVDMATSAGDIEIELDADAAPCTVNSFVSLAKQGYFDDTSCHRLTVSPGFSVLQCGDPSGSGRGGPGYSFADELSGDETYSAGTVAMANAGPDTNGSQFFLVYGDTQLTPDYTVFGHMDDDSIAVVQKVADQGVVGGAPDGAPVEPVTITGVSVDD